MRHDINPSDKKPIPQESIQGCLGAAQVPLMQIDLFYIPPYSLKIGNQTMAGTL